MIGILGPVLGKLGGELIDNLFETEEEKAAKQAFKKNKSMVVPRLSKK